MICIQSFVQTSWKEIEMYSSWEWESRLKQTESNRYSARRENYHGKSIGGKEGDGDGKSSRYLWWKKKK